MKRFINWLVLLVCSVSLVFACCGCTEKQPDGQVQQPAAPSDLMTLLYQLVEEQSAEVPRERVYIVSHRANTLQGVKDYVPENSIKMIELAIAAGSDMVELDVRPTKDGELVLMHDETIDRTTTGKGKVSSMTYADIQKYDLKRSTEVSEGMKVPTMREALLACKGKVYVNLDIANKNVPVAKCAALIQELGMTDQVMIYSGKDELLDYQSIDPNIIIHPFVHSVQDAISYRQYPSALLFQYSYQKYDVENPVFAKEMRAAGFLTYSNILDFDAQLKVGNYAALDRFIASETDFIQTDYVEIVDAYLKERGLR